MRRGRKRYGGFMTKGAGKKMPRKCLSVVCSASIASESAQPVKIRERLTAWHLDFSANHPDMQSQQSYLCGAIAAGFWTFVEIELSTPGEVWLFGEPLSRELALLGVWEKLASGTLEIIGQPQGSEAIEDSMSATDRTYALVLEDPPFIMSLVMRGRPGVLHCVCMRNYGIEGIAPDAPPDRRAAEISRYVRAMLDTLRVEGLGSLKSTAASQAWSAWRTKHLTHSPLFHTDKAALRLEAEGIHGGRCECYRVGRVQGPLYQLDVASMYGWIAASYELPVSCEGSFSGDPVDMKSVTQGPFGAMARVTLRTALPQFPYIPAPGEPLRSGDTIHRGPGYGEHGERQTIFPTGRITTVLCGPELRAAVDGCTVERVHWINVYRMAPLLQSYMHHVYGLRRRAKEDGDAHREQWLKRLAVSIIGRFAQRERRWYPAPGFVPALPYQLLRLPAVDGSTQRVRVIGWYAETEVTGGFVADAVPAVTAFVAAHGRQLLWRLMCTAGLQHVYYVDTDELWTDTVGMEALTKAGCVGPGGWGLLRLKAAHEWAEFYGQKHYRTGTVSVRAGIPRGSEASIDGTGEYFTREGIMQSAAQGRAPSSLVTAHKAAGPTMYTHGEVCDDGVVRPWHIAIGRERADSD